MAGITYPKKGVNHISLLLGTFKNKEEGALMARVAHFEIPKTLTFEIPPAEGYFKKCKVTLTPLQ